MLPDCGGSSMKQLLALLLLTFLVTPVAWANSSLCTDSLKTKDSFETAFEDLSLTDPEIEAKFLIPSKKIFQQLKKLVGAEVVLKDRDGNLVRYRVTMNKEHIYEDTNFDTKDLALFGKRGMLRQRIRYDRKPGEKEYKFAKAVFQAKNGPVENAAFSTAVFARNEVRGEEFKKLKKFMKARRDLLGSETEDSAVLFAKKYSESSAKLKPVLFIRDERFFMKLEKTGSPDLKVPWFYISLDDVSYRGLVKEEGKAARLELEAEMGDEIQHESSETANAKLYLMDQLSRYLEREFGLLPSPESKYESGVQLTVLKKSRD